MKFRSFICLLVLLLTVSLLSGCHAIGLDVETQLMPPESSSEHDAIRTALGEYITANTKNGESSDYTLKYPSGGRYLSAFIMLDQVQPHAVLDEIQPKSVGSTASETVLAFYRRNDENALVHINLLQRGEDGVWKSVADAEGKGESVNQVEFADLNNDGIPELLIGWSLYNTRDSRLTVYDIDDALAARTFSATYTHLVVGDITADGGDDLLLLSASGSTDMVSAQMFSFQSDNMIVSGHAFLDSDIVHFGEHITARLSNDVNGVFLDCYKEQDAMITELLYWKDKKLVAPLCDQNSQFNTVTAREIEIAARDIDGDGAVEWPFTTRMPGFEESDPQSALWYTEWRSYDFSSNTVNTEFSVLYPLQDGYMLRLREDWKALPVAYDAETHVLTLYREGDSGEWLFRIGAFPIEEKEQLPEGYELFEEYDGRAYAVCLAEGNTALTMEELRYLFNVWEREAVA